MVIACSSGFNTKTPVLCPQQFFFHIIRIMGARGGATSRKVAGSIPDGVIGIFHWHNPSCRTMTLGSTQPLTEMSTSNISWGIKAAGAYGWHPYNLHVPTVLKSEILKLLEPSGPVQACNGIVLPFIRILRPIFVTLHLVWYRNWTLDNLFSGTSASKMSNAISYI